MNAMLTLSCAGPVEIAAVGVSIAIFNQASKVAIFPLVSITTSFVAEEETIGKTCASIEEDENPRTCSTKNIEKKESMPDDEMLEKLERGSTDNREVKHLVPSEGTLSLKMYCQIHFTN